MFEIITNGIFYERGAPRYGMQDMGVTPGGVMDRFAYETGNTLLGNRADEPCLEIIFPPVVKFNKPAYFTITGAPCPESSLESGNKIIKPEHGKVFYASAGSILKIGPRAKGFRTYLCYHETGHTEPDREMTSRSRGPWDYSWPDEKGFIRVMEGPEYSLLKNPEEFFRSCWRIGRDSNDMGLRLASAGNELEAAEINMISDAVADGTIQLTPDGPIILLRHRQTMGGYPRILNCISADIDMLAQYAPGQLVKFRKVTFKEARSIAILKKKELDGILKNSK